MSLLFKIFLLVSSLYIFTYEAHSARLRCEGFNVAFEYEDAKDMKCVCEMAKSTITFLEKLGLETTEMITVKLVENFPSNQITHVIGYYNSASGEINLLTYSKAVERLQNHKSPMNFDLNEDIWCSYVAHELAHAISSHYISSERNRHTASEYIAAVTQLAVLSPESRENILKKYKNVEAYKSMPEISILYFLFNPNEFAVKCYLHFMSLEEPKEFIERILETDDEFFDRF